MNHIGKCFLFTVHLIILVMDGENNRKVFIAFGASLFRSSLTHYMLLC